MTRAWILMTALPPTKGHLNLIRFGASLAAETHVLLCTQPSEPMGTYRVAAVRNAVKSIGYSRVVVHNITRELPQDPQTPGFWDLWKYLMTDGMDEKFFINGVRPGDVIVSSEPYGKTLADLTGATFMPYDPARELHYTKATAVRNNMVENFDQIMPEFQHNLRTNIVVFGAESTGKTTLSKALADEINGHWFFEYARPYLETVGPEITIDSMNAIWDGQVALQGHSYDFYDKPYAFFDTDLYSTIGYWEQPHWTADLGPVPEELKKNANFFKADLYIITRSNIPFEEDPIRYGGDHRESPDEYWIDLAEKYGLNYVVLDAVGLDERLSIAANHARMASQAKQDLITYDRGGF